MNVGQFFGDDEHTASDGVYIRLLKSRKWLYLTTGTAALHLHQLMDYPSLTKISGGLLAVPSSMAGFAILTGLFLLITQYALLLIQAIFAYPNALRDRLFKNRSEQFEELEASTVEAAARRRELGEEFAKLVEEVSPSAALLLVTGEKHPSLGSDFRHLLSGQSDLANRVTAQSKSMSPNEMDQAIIKAKAELDRYSADDLALETSFNSLNEQLKALASRQKQLINDTPERRKIFILSEIALDLVRIIPPIVFAAYVTWLAVRMGHPIG